MRRFSSSIVLALSTLLLVSISSAQQTVTSNQQTSLPQKDAQGAIFSSPAPIDMGGNGPPYVNVLYTCPGQIPGFIPFYVSTNPPAVCNSSMH